MRLFTILGLFIILNTTTAFAHREKSYFLYGHFGNKEVCVQIDEYGDLCTARYFTPDDRYDRNLEGNILNDNTFYLAAYTWDSIKKEKEKTESFTVSEIEKDVWKGTWTDQKGSKQSVDLKPIVIDSLNHPFAGIIKKYGVSPYSAYRTRDVNFENSKKEKIGKAAWVQEVSDPLSGIQSFRLIPNRKTFPRVDSKLYID